MPRNPTTLHDNLRDLVWQPTQALETREATAQAWADAYGAYAAEALGCGTPPSPGAVDAAKARLAPVLAAGLLGVVASATAQAFEAAFIAFWTGFVFTGTPVLLPGTPTLAVALLNQWETNPALSDIDTAINLHVATIHVWTTTVLTGLPCNAPIT